MTASVFLHAWTGSQVRAGAATICTLSLFNDKGKEADKLTPWSLGNVILHVENQETISSITVKMEGISKSRLLVPKEQHHGHQHQGKAQGKAEVEFHKVSSPEPITRVPCMKGSSFQPGCRWASSIKSSRMGRWKEGLLSKFRAHRLT